MTELKGLHDDSRVWIYQADSFFTDEQMPELDEYVQQYVNQWMSHNNDLKAFGTVLHKRFVCLFVDESLMGASGCSIDDSVRFINKLGDHYGKNMIERQHFGYLKDKEVHFVHMNELGSLFKAKGVSENTLFFNNLVKTKKEFVDAWLKPLSESWHKRFL